MEDSAAAIESVNTIVNDDGVLTASNTDYEAIAQLLAEHDRRPATVGAGARLGRHGEGGRGRVPRGRASTTSPCWRATRQAGSALAEKYGYALGGRTIREPGVDVIVNVTPLGMHGADAAALSFSDAQSQRATTVFDVVAFPAETPLIVGRPSGRQAVIRGAEVIALQAARQFERYTGVPLTASRSRGPRRSRGPSSRAGIAGREPCAGRASVHERARARSRAARGWRSPAR